MSINFKNLLAWNRNGTNIVDQIGNQKYLWKRESVVPLIEFLATQENIFSFFGLLISLLQDPLKWFDIIFNPKSQNSLDPGLRKP